MSTTDPVRKWLSALGTLCAAPVEEAEARKRIDAYAAMLVREFQPWAFTGSSLSAVARQCKFWPAYGELCGYLSAWCRDNMPTVNVPRLAGPDDLSPAEYRAKQDAEDRKWWEDRIYDLHGRHPGVRWVRGMEMLGQVSQPDSYPRPWIVPLLKQLIEQAVADGADTSFPIKPPVPYPQKKPKPLPAWKQRMAAE